MSTRNPTKFTAIREIVRRGQDTLARIPHRFDYDPYPKGHHGHNGHPVVIWPTSPPQTLGELCLEVAENYRLTHGDGPKKGQKSSTCLYHPRNVYRPDYGWYMQVLEIPFGDVMDFRRELYHRNTDPLKELSTQRAEKLISMVMDACSPGTK